jgi:hypothetical protein
LRVEDQFGGRLARAGLPELDEAEDLVGLLGLGQTGVAVAQDPLGGIVGQEDEDALLPAAAAGNVVFFEGFLLGVGWDGVEIQIKGIAAIRRRSAW